jgi:hypothetical protein
MHQELPQPVDRLVNLKPLAQGVPAGHFRADNSHLLVKRRITARLNQLFVQLVRADTWHIAEDPVLTVKNILEGKWDDRSAEPIV